MKVWKVSLHNYNIDWGRDQLDISGPVTSPSHSTSNIVVLSPRPPLAGEEDEDWLITSLWVISLSPTRLCSVLSEGKWELRIIAVKLLPTSAVSSAVQCADGDDLFSHKLEVCSFSFFFNYWISISIIGLTILNKFLASSDQSVYKSPSHVSFFCSSVSVFHLITILQFSFCQSWEFSWLTLLPQKKYE